MWTGPGGTITSDTVTRSLSGKVLTDTVDGSLAWTYSYDAVGRLTGAVGSGTSFSTGTEAPLVAPPPTTTRMPV